MSLSFSDSNYISRMQLIVAFWECIFVEGLKPSLVKVRRRLQNRKNPSKINDETLNATGIAALPRSKKSSHFSIQGLFRLLKVHECTL